MTGVATVLWKELREAYGGAGRPLVGLIVGAAFTGLMAVAIPILVAIGMRADQQVLYAVSVGVGIAGFATFIGFFGPLATVVDSFAGERERHTLETLLATPLSDRAILWGKVLAQYVGVWATVVLMALVSTATAMVIAGVEGLLSLPISLVGGLVGATVTATFMVGLGSLISLRAPSVKKGQEWLSYAMFPIFFIPGVVGPLLRVGRADDLGDLVLQSAILGIGLPALIVVLAIVFMILLFTRFRRDRLLAR